jgi:hypothetical protein
MNNLKTTYNGGFDLKLDDFRWIHSGVLSGFKGLMSTFGVDDQNTIILSGCERSLVSSTVSITEGYVSIGGEVCYVAAHSYPEPAVGEYEYWVINVTFDPTGLKSFEDSSSHETYEIRVGKIAVSNVVPAGHTVYSDAKTLAECIRIAVNNKNWISFSSPNSDDFYGPGATPSSAVRRYFKDIDGFVHLRGEFYLDDISVATNTTIGNLPVGFRPFYETVYSITMYSTVSASSFFKLKIQTNGDVVLLGAIGNGNIYLHDVPPFRT